MSPQKVFFPLRELALNADFDKEHMKSEFEGITLVDTQHIKPLDVAQLQIKYAYLQESITQTENKVLTLPSNDNASMQSFLYLNLLFSIDYLLVPKYTIYQKLSKTLLEYFSQQNTTIEAKNEELKHYVEKLKKISFEEFSENFYQAKYTFNPTEKSPFDEISSFINESLTKIRWYKNNRYTQIIPTIYKYIAFYTLYNFGFPPTARELMHLLVEVQNAEYFSKLGYTKLYDEEKNIFSKRNISARIEQIEQSDQNHTKELNNFADNLNWSSLNDFSNSFYLQLQNLNFEEI
jgi:hypothetical protein